MTEPLQPGKTGEPLSTSEVVFRLLKASKDGVAVEAHFALSEEDKQAKLPALSVWAVRLTTPEQARHFFAVEKQADYALCALLNVEDVRTLGIPELPHPVLEVVWDTLYEEGITLPDTRPGAKGHAGITGLVKPPGMERRIYKKLRTRLADLANQNLRPLS